MAKHDNLFAVCPPWAQAMVVQELEECGFRSIRESRGGVYFKGHVGRANRLLACPSRILWIQGAFKAHNFEELGVGLRSLDLDRFGGVEVHASCSYSALYHSEAVAERVASYFEPGDLGLFIRIHKDRATVSIDSSGERLHRRGWRLENGPAPMRETVAQCLLRYADWDLSESLCDPMCGSGTFLIEAAIRGSGLAPGRLRRFACDAWSGPGREMPTQEFVTPVLGGDIDATVLEGARRNAARAEVRVEFQCVNAAQLLPPTEEGLMVCNPPYGIRLAQGRAYQTLGNLMSGRFARWRSAIVCPDERAIRALGRKPKKRIHFKMGGLPLMLAVFEPQRG